MLNTDMSKLSYSVERLYLGHLNHCVDSSQQQ